MTADVHSRPRKSKNVFKRMTAVALKALPNLEPRTLTASRPTPTIAPRTWSLVSHSTFGGHLEPSAANTRRSRPKTPALILSRRTNRGNRSNIPLLIVSTSISVSSRLNGFSSQIGHGNFAITRIAHASPVPRRAAPANIHELYLALAGLPKVALIRQAVQLKAVKIHGLSINCNQL